MAKKTSTHTAADYKKSTAYESSPKQIKQREERNKARYDVAAHISKAAMAGKDVDHHDPLRHGGSNKPSNWDLRSIHANRGDNKD